MVENSDDKLHGIDGGVAAGVNRSISVCVARKCDIPNEVLLHNKIFDKGA